jgi:DNA-binding CsgD family transcriptional regulator
MMIRLGLDGHNISALNITRPKSRPQFDRAELELASQLHPHLMRAFALTRKVAWVRHLSDDLVSALDGSPHGVFLLDRDGRVRHANRVGEALASKGDALCLAGGRLGAVQQAAARKFAGLIESAASTQAAGGRGGSMALPSPVRRLPLSVTVAPARSGRLSLFDRDPSVIVCVTDLEAGVRLPEQKLRELFGLTPAETRVTIALFEGMSPQEAAENLGVSFHTVRVHLGRIFEKTGTHRQTELVRLMMRAVGVLYE